MTHVVYSYVDGIYLFQTKSTIFPYEDEIPTFKSYVNNLRRKKNDGLKLTTIEHQNLKGFDEMEEDRTKNPSERSAGKSSNSLEEYHIEHHIRWGPWRGKIEACGGRETIVPWQKIHGRNGKRKAAPKKGGKRKRARQTPNVY